MTAFHHLQDPITGNVSPSLSSEGMAVAYALRRDPGGTGQGHNTNYVAGTVRSHTRPGSNTSTDVVDGAAVRRLTPIECERLQGLPDNWTQVPDTAPDSRRYAGLGDAVTAHVAEWLGRRLLEVEATYTEAVA